MNNVKDINTESVAKFENINVVNNDAKYDKVVEYIEFVVRNSYDKAGNYHEYLQDYSEAVALITMYTDYDGEFGFSDVMDFIQTEKWEKIKDELDEKYVNFHYYVKSEVTYLNAPLRMADRTLATLTITMMSANKILEAIDVDALKNYDFSKIVNAVEEIENAKSEN